jgi:hypothetical protein
MLRGRVQPDKLTGEKHFRWRGGDVSRLEGLCDAVFALALTLLVVRLDVPRSYAEVEYSLVRAPVYLACFSFLIWIWYCHYQFHRRYGLEGALAVALDAALVFVVLLFALPLRFFGDLLFSLAYHGDVFQRSPDGSLLVGPAGENILMIDLQVRNGLMAAYSSGFIVIFGLFTVLTYRAWSLRSELELDPVEELVTKNTMRAHGFSAGLGVVVLCVALFGGRFADLAGYLFLLMGPVHAALGVLQGKGVKRLAAA